jgi:hypothetical protein
MRQGYMLILLALLVACGGGSGGGSGGGGSGGGADAPGGDFTDTSSNNGGGGEMPAIGNNTDNTGSPLGTNVARLGSSEALWLINQAPRAVGWLTQCDDCNATTASGNFDTEEQSQLVFDDNGWVKSFGNNPARKFTHIGMHLFAGASEFAPAGEWIVLYEGEATLEYSFQPFVTVVSRAPGRDVLRITPEAGSLLLLKISGINPANHLRNIRIIPPGGVCAGDPFRYAATATACGGDAFEGFETRHTLQRFHPLYLAQLRRYSTLRFMQFQATVDDLTEKTWAQRSHLTDALWPDGPTNSPPQELIFELSNQVNADAWVTLPYWAGDAFAREFALLARSMLADNLNVYLEYSNEVWNGAFPFSLYGNEIEAWGKARWPASRVGNAFTDFDKRINYYGMRSAQVCAIWKQTFGDQADRVRCVMGAAPFGYWAEQALACPLHAADSEGVDCAGQMYAVAAAPYFGGYIANTEGVDDGREARLESWAADADGGMSRIFNELRTGQELRLSSLSGGAIEAAMDVVDQNREVAVARNLRLISYEGGQHLAPVFPLDDNETIGDMLIAANRDARMEQLYLDYLAAWRARGGELFVHYQDVYLPSSRFGSWGALEYVGQPAADTHKYRALQRYIDTQPASW